MEQPKKGDQLKKAVENKATNVSTPSSGVVTTGVFGASAKQAANTSVQSTANDSSTSKPKPSCCAKKL